MKWSEINHTHNGKKAKVSSQGTPQHPREYIEFGGTILCQGEGMVPLLTHLTPPFSDAGVANFAGWYNVEIEEPDENTIL